MMLRVTLAAAALVLLPLVQAGSSCIAMDASWNLLAFNLNGKDYNAGTKDKWSSGSPTELTTSGRPPFSGSNVTCYFSQFSNAIYVLGADSSSPTNIHIYDAAANSWSTQSVSGPDGFDPASLVTILDHDTNVFYGLSKGELYSLQIGDTLKAATSETKTWQDISKPSFSTDGYSPVMALAQNHIHFLNVPNVAAGSAQIFVIHFSYWQPEVQKYGDFPASHGQTASIFLNEGVQQEFAFIPDSGDSTYVINVESNTTRTLAGPSTKDPLASYFAAPESIVQLTSNGAVNYIPYSNGSDATSAQWSTVQVLANAAPPSSTSASAGASGSKSGSGSAASSTGSGSPNAAASLAGSSFPALAASVSLVVVGAAALLVA